MDVTVPVRRAQVPCRTGRKSKLWKVLTLCLAEDMPKSTLSSAAIAQVYPDVVNGART